jgi:3-hydroxyisobutyrate dehydrogenase-like beta-hydroxyacid dehydrogenase
MATVGLLHPGAMGAAIGKLLRPAGHDVAWVRAGRSVETTRRAQDADLRPVAGLRVLAKECPVVLSVCPPENAVEVARELANEGFKGTYVDANAISPSAAAWIESIVTTSGGTFVDAGIVGPPPVTAGSTRLFLSGSAAGSIAKLFQGTALEPVVVGERVGAASAAKLAYAGWTKATSALLLALRSYARAWDVEAALLDEWRRSQPELPERSAQTAQRVHQKAWRWVAEMRFIGESMAEAGLPPGFHDAAADIFAELAHLKGDPHDQDPEHVFDLVRTPKART